ncbi:MAG: hypothetical protein ABR875_00330 [Minisyncoccia bacterium]|jgi:hypothetical protein
MNKEKPSIILRDGTEIYGSHGPTEETKKAVEEQEQRDIEFAKQFRDLDKNALPPTVEVPKEEKKDNVIEFPSRKKADGQKEAA